MLGGRLTFGTKGGAELVSDFVHRVRAKGHCTHMKFLHFHLCQGRPLKEESLLVEEITIPSQGASLIAKKILYSAEFFR